MSTNSFTLDRRSEDCNNRNEKEEEEKKLGIKYSNNDDIAHYTIIWSDE